MPQPLTVEFLALAIELIDEFCPDVNAVWESNADGNIDPAKPWITEQGLVTEYDVRIIFFPYGMKTLQYIPNMELVEGHVTGLMYPVDDFVPTLKDTVIFQELHLNVKAIESLRPIDDVIIYELDLLI